MPYLSYISDQDLEKIVRSVIDRGVEALASTRGKRLEKNVIDPFAMLFEMASFHLNDQQWLLNESSRQAQKTLTNHIGGLHQKILGSVDGWEDLGTGSAAGCDVVNHERKIIAEIKNKHNTVKKSDEIGLYDALKQVIMPKAARYKGYTAYYVTVIPQKPERFDREFTPSNRSTGTTAERNPLIRSIDGASFYSLVTNEHNALQNLFLALPQVIQQIYPDHAVKPSQLMANYFSKAFGT